MMPHWAATSNAAAEQMSMHCLANMQYSDTTACPLLSFIMHAMWEAAIDHLLQILQSDNDVRSHQLCRQLEHHAWAGFLNDDNSK